MDKRQKYRVHDWVKFNYTEIGEYIDENHTDKPLRNDEIVDLLNQLSDWNEELKRQRVELYKDITRLVKEKEALEKENLELNHIKTFAEKNGINIHNIEEAFRRVWDDNARLITENSETRKELNHLENIISENIKHQKTKIGEKTLKNIIQDHNDWLLGHKKGDK